MIPIEFAFEKLSFDLGPHFLKRGVKYIIPEISKQDWYNTKKSAKFVRLRVFGKFSFHDKNGRS